MMTALENNLRWQSRRGLLELDLVLDKFWQQSDTLPTNELQALSELLALGDEELWHKINGNTATIGENDTPKNRIIARLQSL
ncbi:MAG: succinate dehydrogenase assembly factor 2 [Gammaproteobacteria bacterium WSBS_2016_MAG_OTU1]